MEGELDRKLKTLLSYSYTLRFVSQWHCEEHEREHEQTKLALCGMLHTPIYLAMTIATQIGAANAPNGWSNMATISYR